MADPKDEAIDIDTLSDEEFMKLDPSQMQEVVPTEEEDVIDDPDGGEENTPGSEDDKTPVVETPPPSEDDPDDDKSGDNKEPEAPKAPDENSPDEEFPKTPVADKAKVPDKKPADKPVKEAPKGTDEKPAKPDAAAKPDPKDAKQPNEPVVVDKDAAVDFFTKVSAPFKADGKDMQVRTPEDVIRLMQMGVNYSRRMAEMKPLRAQDQMLKANNLNDPEKLNFLIDISKGNKDAIKKLLKDHNIDPVDIDTSIEDKPYRATNYQSDPKDLAFNEAIQETMTAPGGRELIQDINRDWDDISKEALRDQPGIFQNILEQKTSGVYSKIKTELEYQRTMGFLTSVPFLQAYHQVGEAMQKAGVFDPVVTQDQPKVAEVAPLGTGTRKAAPKPKIEHPTPNVSSATPPRSVPANAGGQNEPDYSSMSDEDFLKMAPPG